MTTHAALLTATLGWMTASPVSHAASVGHACAGPKRPGETISCEMYVGYDEPTGATVEVTEAYATVDPMNDAVVVSFEIVEAFGNTTATVGGALPFRLGPALSPVDGLPGHDTAGYVLLRQSTYVVHADDPNPLPVMQHLELSTVCAAASPEGCAPLPTTFDWVVATDLNLCPTDVDASGGTGASDVFAIISAWGTCGDLCAADVDVDGEIGFGDMLAVLSAWGTCP